MSGQSEEFEVDPARLQSGRYDHATNRVIGEGDIARSYSAERIGMGQPIRRPFLWRGQVWVCTSILREGAQVYRLVQPEQFPGVPTTYPEKTRDDEAARKDPMGFYHGMTINLAGRPLVLCGPEVRVKPRPVPEPQTSLFEALEQEQTRGR